MQVVVYYRRSIDPDLAARELAVQRSSVAAWLSEHAATVVAAFTEEETGGKARPQFGQALHRARTHAAKVLIATTKALDTSGRFEPSSPWGGPECICLDDPAEVAKREWQRSPQFVVYLRDLRGCGDKAETSLAQQQAAVAAFIVPGCHVVVATLIELESPQLDPSRQRSVLQAALALCREHRARLLIGTIERFPNDKPHLLDFTDVPYAVAWEEPVRFVDTIPAPFDLPAPVALHLGSIWHRGRRGLYLANATADDLLDVTATRSGWTQSFGDLVVAPSLDHRIARVAAGTAQLVDTHDAMLDGDFMLHWRITATTPDGRTWVGSVDLPKGDVQNRQLALRNWAPVAPATPADLPAATDGDTA